MTILKCLTIEYIHEDLALPETNNSYQKPT